MRGPLITIAPLFNRTVNLVNGLSKARRTEGELGSGGWQRAELDAELARPRKSGWSAPESFRARPEVCQAGLLRREIGVSLRTGRSEAVLDCLREDARGGAGVRPLRLGDGALHREARRRRSLRRRHRPVAPGDRPEPHYRPAEAREERLTRAATPSLPNKAGVGERISGPGQRAASRLSRVRRGGPGQAGPRVGIGAPRPDSGLPSPTGGARRRAASRLCRRRGAGNGLGGAAAGQGPHHGRPTAGRDGAVDTRCRHTPFATLWHWRLHNLTPHFVEHLSPSGEPQQVSLAVTTSVRSGAWLTHSRYLKTWRAPFVFARRCVGQIADDSPTILAHAHPFQTP